MSKMLRLNYTAVKRKGQWLENVDQILLVLASDKLKYYNYSQSQNNQLLSQFNGVESWESWYLLTQIPNKKLLVLLKIQYFYLLANATDHSQGQVLTPSGCLSPSISQVKKWLIEKRNLASRAKIANLR